MRSLFRKEAKVESFERSQKLLSLLQNNAYLRSLLIRAWFILSEVAPEKSKELIDDITKELS